MKQNKYGVAANRLVTSDAVHHVTVLWPSVVHALSPPVLMLLISSFCTFFLPIASIDTNFVIPMSHSNLNSANVSERSPNSQNASFTNVINRHLTTAISNSSDKTADKSLPPFNLDKEQYNFLLEKETKKYRLSDKLPSVVSRRLKRSSLFGRKRQNGHLSGLGGGKSGANHTGQSPNLKPTHNYLEPWTANPNYWIPDRYHENAVCLLATFAGIVRIRPSNSTFRGGTFSISPEESLGRRANCERNSRNMFWKFSQSDEREVVNEDEEEEYDVNLEGGEEAAVAAARKMDTSSSSRGRSSSSGSSSRSARVVLVERSNRLLSAGFHVVGSVIEFHVAYIECLQQADKNVLNGRYRVYGDGVCVNLSVSFDVGSFGDRFAYECNHIWGKTLKDVHYNQNRRNYAGEVQISLKMVRIDKDPFGYGPYSFRKSRRRCAWDSVLSWQSISITVTLLVLFIAGFFALCVCSNSNCSSAEGQSINWCLCCLCCCRCCRRRNRGPLPSRPLVERTQPPNRPSANHASHSTYRSHAPPPPPPPPAPPSSSMSSSRNATTYSRKPTFSTTSYSYDGNGSNPTGQSSSAMSTALETDDESANGGLGGRNASLKHQFRSLSCQSGGQFRNVDAAFFLTQKKSNCFKNETKAVALRNTNSSVCSLSVVSSNRKKHQQRLPFSFISTTSTCQQMEWVRSQKLLQELLNRQWLNKLTCDFKHESFTLSLASPVMISNQNEPKIINLNTSHLLCLYFFYCQLKTWQMTLGHLPRSAYRDLFPQCASVSAKLVNCRSTSYQSNAIFDQLLPSL